MCSFVSIVNLDDFYIDLTACIVDAEDRIAIDSNLNNIIIIIPNGLLK